MTKARKLPMKRRSLDERIAAAWRLHESSEPDISDARLMQMVADDTGADIPRICNALRRSGMLSEASE
ncbi:MAG TPA: hypothetical protein VHU42_18465 [Rhodopila sp.]|jgi:hypothetical protein|nr:hypothetical protein [Rhodopila sp.]